MPTDRILTLDLGGSGLKAGLFAPDGTLQATASVPMAFDEPREGISEQDPAVWWAGARQALSEIAAAAGPDFDRVSGIAICGFTRTQVLLDAEGCVVRPAIGFRDARAGAEVAAALARPEFAAHPAARPFNVFHPLARLLWVAAHEPEVWSKVAWVVEPKDHLNFRLTGRVASDAVSQHWMAMATAGGSDSLAALAGIRPPALPPLFAPHAIVGRVRPSDDPVMARLAGVPVFCGANDSWAAAAGLGALAPGRAYGISGSSEVFGLIADHAAEAEGLLTLPWGDGLWQIGGPGLNGANALAWIVDRLDRSDLPFEAKLAGLLAGPRHAAPLLFLPYLVGERTPFWDGDLRAAFLGLGAGHGPADLVRAVMEGVAFHARLVLERAEAAVGRRASEVRLGGGGAASSVWNQIRADGIGREIVAMPQRQTGLAGCFAVAQVGLGLAPDLAAAIDGAGLAFERFRPDPAAARRADRLHAIFRESQGFVADVSRRLAAIDRDPSASG
ncbi:xylulokinase [Siculibacillus lacustris]|uniref:xylulokinase n=1 Tax=Siculibacillus lacustris TaxID=1549641 RepID=UPI0013F15794|nr:FGGY family carbohydrate kinase [Siculibacillus lacustris]